MCQVGRIVGPHEIYKLSPTGVAPASFAVFGVGCAGTAGVPELGAAAGSLPWLGETFTLELRGLPASPGSTPFGVLGLSRTDWGGFALPRNLMSIGLPDCTQYVSLDFSSVLANDDGTAAWNIGVPPGANLIGVRFFTQGVVLDSGANPGHAVLTNAAECVVAARSP